VQRVYVDNGQRVEEAVVVAVALVDQPVKVLVDPMPTVLTSVLELLGPLRGRVPNSLSRRAQDLARSVPLSPVLDVVADPFGGGVPDFLGTPATDRDLSFAEVVDILRAMSDDEVIHALEDHGRDPGVNLEHYQLWLDRPRRAIDRFCTALQAYWDNVVCEVYPDAMQRVAREARRLDTMVDACGAEATIANASPRVTLRDNQLVRPLSSFQPAWTGGRRQKSGGLILRPMIASPRTAYDNLHFPGGVPTISFATPALASRATTKAAALKDPLPGLIGATRTRLLRQLARRPATTTELADVLGMAPSTVSYHLAGLSDIHVTCRVAAKGRVLYHLTARGDRLLQL
jgi:DNA-binding transcriptional ArsR family regulator